VNLLTSQPILVKQFYKIYYKHILYVYLTYLLYMSAILVSCMIWIGRKQSWLWN